MPSDGLTTPEFDHVIPAGLLDIVICGCKVALKPCYLPICTCHKRRSCTASCSLPECLIEDGDDEEEINIYMLPNFLFPDIEHKMLLQNL